MHLTLTLPHSLDSTRHPIPIDGSTHICDIDPLSAPFQQRPIPTYKYLTVPYLGITTTVQRHWGNLMSDSICHQ